MSVESESERRIYEKLQSMEERIDDLKSGYLLINQRYSETLSVLKRLTSSTLEAATRAAVSAEKSADACHTLIPTQAQAQVITVPDVGAATGAFVVTPTAFVMKSVAGAAAAGGAAAQSFTDAFCTSGSNVIGNWNTQANAVSVLKIVPGNGSFVVTSSGDAGVGTFNYIITK